MGLLTTPHDTLCPDIWDLKTNKLKASMKIAMLERLSQLVPLKVVSRIVILGSTTGYKWNLDSDIDTNVEIAQELITPELQAKRKLINGHTIADTAHPVNFFLTPTEFSSNWQDAFFGIYDVLQGIWLSPVVERSQIRDPKEEFRPEIISATKQLNYFRRLVKLWKTFESLGKTKLAEKYFTEAKEYAQQIDLDRKVAYDVGWGIPRNTWQNVLYKVLEGSDVGADFEYLKEIKDKKEL